jgi:DNA-binding protein HU-beta
MITKALLAKELRKPGLSYRDASVYIDVLTEAMVEMLTNGESIQLRGFGTFLVKKHAARKTAINSNMEIPEHNRIVFRPCDSLKKSVKNFCKRSTTD